MSALKRKVETAWTAVVATLSGVPTINKGADAGELSIDRVVVECLGGIEEPRGTGNRAMTVRVVVISGADAKDDDETSEAAAERHAANCGAVFEGITGLGLANLPGLLSAAVADFYVFEEGVSELGEDPELAGRKFEEGRVYSCYCCGMDLV